MVCRLVRKRLLRLLLQQLVGKVRGSRAHQEHNVRANSEAACAGAAASASRDGRGASLGFGDGVTGLGICHKKNMKLTRRGED